MCWEFLKGAARMAVLHPFLGNRHLQRSPRWHPTFAIMLALTLKNQSVGIANCANPSCSRNRNRANESDMKRVGRPFDHACNRRI